MSNEDEYYFKQNLASIETLIERAKKSGLKREQYLDYAVEKMLSILAPIFEVSEEVIRKRLKYSDLIALIP